MIRADQRVKIEEKMEELTSKLPVDFACRFPVHDYDKKRMAYVQVIIFTPGEDLRFFSYQETIDFLRGAIFMTDTQSFLELLRKA